MLFPTEKIFEREQRNAFVVRLLRKIFLEDWTMKLVALIITLGLWLGVTGLRTPTSRRIANVPLSLRVANEFEITNSPVAEVTIKISGDKGKIDQINQRDLAVNVDLTDVGAGQRTMMLSPSNVSIELPAGFKLEEIQPSRIAVQLERVIERELPVKTETEGAVADGFELYGSTVSPATVRVSGPESFVKPLESVSTEKINVEARQNDFTARQVSLNLVSGRVRLIDTTVVDVSMRIGERRTEKTVVMTVATESGDKRISFKARGPRSVIDGLRPDEITATLFRDDAGEVRFNLTFPDEISGRLEISDQKWISKP